VPAFVERRAVPGLSLPEERFDAEQRIQLALRLGRQTREQRPPEPFLALVQCRSDEPFDALGRRRLDLQRPAPGGEGGPHPFRLPVVVQHMLAEPLARASLSDVVALAVTEEPANLDAMVLGGPSLPVVLLPVRGRNARLPGHVLDRGSGDLLGSAREAGFDLEELEEDRSGRAGLLAEQLALARQEGLLRSKVVGGASGRHCATLWSNARCHWGSARVYQFAASGKGEAHRCSTGVPLNVRREFHKIWVEQCEAAVRIRADYGLGKALDYLIGEKLFTFVETAETHPEIAAELPAFVGEIRRQFSTEVIRDYLAQIERTRILAPVDREEPEEWDDPEEDPLAGSLLGAEDLLRYARIKRLLQEQ